MKRNARAITSKELKVRTGEVLDSVADGAVVYVTRRGKVIARIEPTTDRREEAEIDALEGLIDDLFGRYRDALPSVAVYSRQKRTDDRRRSQR